MIRLLDLDADFIIDLRYATADNFTGVQVYRSTECWVDAHTAQILIQAKNIFKAAGYRVKIWDAYRPIRAQRRFWEILPDDNFVARPPEVAKIKTFRPSHMNGMCVDVTLTNMDGTDIEMPSPFDTMNERAALSCKRNSAVGQKKCLLSQGSDGIGGIPSLQGRMVALL